MTRDQILAAHEREKVKDICKRHKSFADSYAFLKSCIKQNARMDNTVLTFNLLSNGAKLDAICGCRIASMTFERCAHKDPFFYQVCHRTGDTKITRTREQIEIDLLHYVK